MSYTAAERESVLQCDDENKIWKGYVLQSTVITKMRRAGIEPVRIDSDGAHYYELNFNQISFRSGKKRNVSEEQRKAASKRFKEHHAKKKKGNEEA